MTEKQKNVLSSVISFVTEDMWHSLNDGRLIDSSCPEAKFSPLAKSKNGGKGLLGIYLINIRVLNWWERNYIIVIFIIPIYLNIL